MRCALLAAGLTVLFAQVGSAQYPVRSGQLLRPSREIVVGAERVVRLERWLLAVESHEPGAPDEPATTIGSWSNADLQALWVDAGSLLVLMRDLKRATFSVRVGAQRPVGVVYPWAQLRRLKVLACAAAGITDDPQCLSGRAAEPLDPGLAALARHSAATRKAGDDDNYVIRRAALLHTDIATMRLARTTEPAASPSLVGPERVRVALSDGRDLDVVMAAIHWEIAAMILDHVRPKGASRPNPAGDDMVRRWYRATSAWMQLNEDHDTLHLTRGREIFPTDPEILFLSGCQRETYASPGIQNAIRTAVVPIGYSIDLGSAHAELRRAETFFRGAIARAPDHAEAHLRLGRVLGLLERHAEAAGQLRIAAASLTDPQLQYYAHLFLGVEEEALRQYEAARDEYTRAAELYPRAQSPWLALSQLARRNGDRAGALRAMDRLYALTADDPDRGDPLWVYHTTQARGADERLDELRRPFLAATRP